MERGQAAQGETHVDRVAEVAATLPEGSIIVNVQGDEPLISPETIDRAVEALRADTSADMATVFEKSPQGYFDARAGRRLRDEIYAPGDSRDVTVSIEKFLGRKQSIEPFLKTLGMGKQ